MLAIEAVRDAASSVDVVEDPVSVVWHGCGEDHYFKVFTKFCEEPYSSGSYEVVPRLFTLRILLNFKMNKSLIQVKH